MMFSSGSGFIQQYKNINHHSSFIWNDSKILLSMYFIKLAVDPVVYFWLEKIIVRSIYHTHKSQ